MRKDIVIKYASKGAINLRINFRFFYSFFFRQCVKSVYIIIRVYLLVWCNAFSRSVCAQWISRFFQCILEQPNRNEDIYYNITVNIYIKIIFVPRRLVFFSLLSFFLLKSLLLWFSIVIDLLFSFVMLQLFFLSFLWLLFLLAFLLSVHYLLLFGSNYWFPFSRSFCFSFRFLFEFNAKITFFAFCLLVVFCYLIWLFSVGFSTG